MMQNDEIGMIFKTNIIGSKQGNVECCTLFNLFINDLSDALKEKDYDNVNLGDK